MEARLCYIGHGVMENRSGLEVDAQLTLVSGHAERLPALAMIERAADRPVTLSDDKGYNAAPRRCQEPAHPQAHRGSVRVD